MLCSCPVIAKSACPGRKSLGDATRYDNKRGMDIWCKSRSYLRDGGDLVFGTARRSRSQEFKKRFGWVNPNSRREKRQMDAIKSSLLLDQNQGLSLYQVHVCIRAEICPLWTLPLNPNTSALGRRKGSLLHPATIFHLSSWHSQPPSIYFLGKPSQKRSVWKL